MAPGVGGLPEETRAFSRSGSSRILSLLVFAGSGAMLLSFVLGTRPVPAASWVVVGFLCAVSGSLLVPNFLDRIELGPEGIRVRNPVLDRLPGARRQGIRWEEVTDLREPRRHVLFLFGPGGRRLVLDSVRDYEDLRDLVIARTGCSLPPGESGGNSQI